MKRQGYMGIDVDTQRLAWCLVQDGRARGCATVQRVNAGREVLPMYDAAVLALFEWAAREGVVVYVEGAYLRYAATGLERSSVQVYGALERVQGELGVLARMSGLVLWGIAPADWQRTMLDVHEGYLAMKEDSVEKAREALGSVIVGEPSHHQADAYHIARFAEKFHARRRAALGSEQLALTV